MSENTDFMLGGMWKSWCRLCAKTNAEYIKVVAGQFDEFIDESRFKCYEDLAKAVLEFFQIHMKEDDKFPQIICKECHEFVLELIKFSDRANKVQQMYNELQNSIGKSTAELQMLLENYGIEAYKDEIMIPQTDMELPAENIFVSEKILTTIEQQEKASAPKNEKQTEFDDPFASDDDRDMDFGESASSYSPTEDGDSSSDSEDIAKTKLKDRPKRAKAKINTNTTDTSEEPAKSNTTTDKAEDPTKLDTTTEIAEDPAKKLYCQICEISLMHRQTYRRHMNRQHGLLNCRLCISSFKNDTDLKEHNLQEHNKKKQHAKLWNCPHCDQTFERNRLRFNHIRKAHKVMKLDCRICKQSFKHGSSYRRHMNQQHDLLTCQRRYCTNTFENDKELMQHMKEEHGQKKKHRKLWNCPHCELSFEKKGLRSDHIKMVHRTDSNMKSSHICPACNQTFEQREQRKQHMLTQHPDYKPNHVCKICGKMFSRMSTLNVHMQTHGEKFICSICGKQLSDQVMLKRHMLVHSDVMPHKCDVCGRGFKRAQALKFHLIAHSGLKPYACDFCNTSFSVGSTLRLHKKKMHPKELAAQEAAGVVQYTKNVPKLADLKAAARTGTKKFRPLMSKQNGYAPIPRDGSSTDGFSN